MTLFIDFPSRFPFDSPLYATPMVFISCCTAPLRLTGTAREESRSSLAAPWLRPRFHKGYTGLNRAIEALYRAVPGEIGGGVGVYRMCSVEELANN